MLIRFNEEGAPVPTIQLTRTAFQSVPEAMLTQIQFDGASVHSTMDDFNVSTVTPATMTLREWFALPAPRPNILSFSIPIGGVWSFTAECFTTVGNDEGMILAVNAGAQVFSDQRPANAVMIPTIAPVAVVREVAQGDAISLSLNVRNTASAARDTQGLLTASLVQSAI